MTLNDILAVKGTKVLTITDRASLADVVQELVEHNVGSLVVCDADGSMVGIISERDILRALASQKSPLAELSVARFMSRHVITGAPQDDVESVMGTLTENRIRHLPVMQDGQLRGMISIGDIVKAQYEHLTRENHYLLAYIQS